LEYSTTTFRARIRLRRLVKQLANSWYEPRRHGRDVPPLEELWDAAVLERQRRGLGKRLPLGDLFRLVYLTLDYCLKKFDSNPVRAERGGHLPPQTRFKTFFRIVLLNRVRDYLHIGKKYAERRKRKQTRMEQYARDTQAPSCIHTARLVQRLRDAVDDLPPDDRWLVRMHYWQGHSFRYIADRDGVPKNSVWRDHQRVLARLKREFIAAGREGTTAA
jgi:RNA polymerase sigma factor (sigma-70 family)